MTVLTLSLGSNAAVVATVPDGPVTIEYPHDDAGITLAHLWGLLQRMYKEQLTMSDKTDKLTTDMAALQATVDQQVSETSALASRVDALNQFKDAALTAAQAGAAAATSERDAAVAELAQIKAAAVAVPADTAALEAQIEALTAKLQSSTAFTQGLDTMPPAPVEQPPVTTAPLPVPVDVPVPVETPVPAVPVPVATAAAAPTGVELTPTAG